MKPLRHLSRVTLPVLLLIFLAGCDLFGSKDPEPAAVTVELSNKIGTQDLALNQQDYTSAVGHDYSVTLVEYIITNIALRNEDGELVDLASAHYFNEEDAATHMLAPVEVPAGTYTAIEFTFGVEGVSNVFGNLARTPDYDNMLWPMMMPMGDGTTERYHYMRFEGRYGSEDGTFRIHVGPTGGNDNSFEVELPLDVSVDGKDMTVGVTMYLDQWLTAPNDWDFDDYGMIMGNQAAQTLIYDNGHSVFGSGATQTN